MGGMTPAKLFLLKVCEPVVIDIDLIGVMS